MFFVCPAMCGVEADLDYGLRYEGGKLRCQNHRDTGGWADLSVRDCTVVRLSWDERLPLEGILHSVHRGLDGGVAEEGKK